MSALPTFAKERRSLKAVISSDCFSRSPHLIKLLTYLCEKYFEGRSAEIKEYSIATDALGRPSDIDDTGSAAARVQMHRLRAKLKEYYEHEGIRDPVRIVLKPGVYTPQFVGVDSSSGASPSPRVDGLELVSPRGVWQKLRPRLWLWGGLVVALVVAAVWFITALVRRNSLPVADQAEFASPSSSPSSSPLTSTRGARLGTSRFSPESGIRILPGSNKPSTVDALGNIWQGDRYFSGGEAEVTSPALLGLTSDPALFETYRQGDFTYKIPLPSGAYELHLYFGDFLGPRLDLQSKKVLTDFRILINGANTWDHQSHALTYGTQPPLQTEKIFKNVSPANDGFLSLRFMPLQNFAFVNAILVFPTPDGKALPIRIVTQQKTVTDQHGQIWLSDRYFTGGNLVVHGMQATGTSDPELLAGERNGNFQYIVPVAESTYTVNLYFVETWFGKGASGGGGVGSRVFRIDCGDQCLQSRLDILAETGASGRVLVKTFHGIKPDSEGNIVLSFIPIENHACINALEIIDEGKEPTPPTK